VDRKGTLHVLTGLELTIASEDSVDARGTCAAGELSRRRELCIGLGCCGASDAQKGFEKSLGNWADGAGGLALSPEIQMDGYGADQALGAESLRLKLAQLLASQYDHGRDARCSVRWNPARSHADQQECNRRNGVGKWISRTDAHKQVPH
jgi:hypothetical protein